MNKDLHLINEPDFSSMGVIAFIQRVTDFIYHCSSRFS
jgi:hypothetical protein